MATDEAKAVEPRPISREQHLQGLKDFRQMIDWIRTLKPCAEREFALHTCDEALIALNFLGHSHEVRMKNAANYVDKLATVAKELNQKNEALAVCAEAFGRAVNYALGSEKETNRERSEAAGESGANFLRDMFRHARERNIPVEIYTYASKEDAEEAAQKPPSDVQPSAAPT